MKTWLIVLSLIFSLFSGEQLTAQIFNHDVSDVRNSADVSIDDQNEYGDIEKNSDQRHVISVYPNPARHVLYIEGDYTYYNIFDPTGKKIITDNQVRLDVADLRSGMYILTVHSKNGDYHAKRVMIR